MSFKRERIIQIVKRIIKLKIEFWAEGNREKSPMKQFLHGKSEGMEKALTVIEGLLDFDSEIHKLIDDSRK